MQRIETFLQGVYELSPLIHRDSRRSFPEFYNHAKFADLGIKDNFRNAIILSLPAVRFAAFTINSPPVRQLLSHRRGRSSERRDPTLADVPQYVLSHYSPK